MRHWEKHSADLAHFFQLNGYLFVPNFVAGDELTIHWAEGNTSRTRSRRALGLVYYAARCQDDVAAKKAYQEQLHADLRATGKI